MTQIISNLFCEPWIRIPVPSLGWQATGRGVCQNWFLVIEPNSGDYFLDPMEEIAVQKAREKYPQGLIGIHRINETGACGTLWFMAGLVKASIGRRGDFWTHSGFAVVENIAPSC